MTRFTRTTLPAVAACTAAALTVGSASAASAATVPTSTRSAITYAAAHNAFTRVVGASNIRVSNIRVTKDGRWASALDTPKNHMTDPAQVLLINTGHRWVATDLGTDAVGCGIVPARVRAELHLHGHC